MGRGQERAPVAGLHLKDRYSNMKWTSHVISLWDLLVPRPSEIGNSFAPLMRAVGRHGPRLARTVVRDAGRSGLITVGARRSENSSWRMARCDEMSELGGP
jgi:hypothetical protein